MIKKLAVAELGDAGNLISMVWEQPIVFPTGWLVAHMRRLGQRAGSSPARQHQQKRSVHVMSNHKLAPEEEEKRMRLYQQGLSDREIAKAVGKSYLTIQKWRHRRKLPPNIKPHGKGTNNQSVSMETVLSPEQCKKMEEFFKHLIYAKKLNPELDIAWFMKEYRKVM